MRLGRVRGKPTMGGLVGWVDFERDMMLERAAVQAMTDTMAHRGPDAAGLWLSPRAALGHRRLAVIDREGGCQPMVAEDNDQPVAVLAHTGEIYNFQDLRAELATRGHPFRTGSDTEVLLRAYLAWGADCAERLDGMYAFAVWDVRREELLLVRDRFGIKPLYYYPTPAGVLFGSEPKAILANPLAERVMGADGLRELLALGGTPGHAIFRGIREVCPGHIVRVSRTGLRPQRYWALEAQPHPDDVATTISTVRELLEDAVTRQLVTDVPLSIHMSGGLDSSAITALAAQALRERGAGRVRTFTADFAWRPDQLDETRGPPDSPYAAELARHVDADHTLVVLSTAELMDPVVRTAVGHARDLPVGLNDRDLSMYLLCRAIRSHSIVTLGGEGADEIFGYTSWLHQPDLVWQDTFPWLAQLAAAGRMHDPGVATAEYLLDPQLLAELDVAGYRADRYRDALAEVPQLPGETGLERRMREVSHLTVTSWLPTVLHRVDRMSMATGLEARIPFCDHRLVEYVFNVPWSMKVFDGREKSLLRAATADLLPDSIVARRQSAYPAVRDPAYEQSLRAAVVALFTSGDAPVLALLDTAQVRAIVDDPTGAASPRLSRSTAEGVLRLNDWLTRYDITTAPDLGR